MCRTDCARRDPGEPGGACWYPPGGVAAAPVGDRHGVRGLRLGDAGAVAILGRRKATATSRPCSLRCSSSALRSSAAPKGDRHPRRCRSGRPWGSCCDPRPPRRATATTDTSGGSLTLTTLRSSAAPKGDRHPSRCAPLVYRHTLRSSAAPKGDRHAGQLPSSTRSLRLRSSAAPKGDRHLRARPPGRRLRPGCDPRPPRRATATRSPSRPTSSAPALRSSAAPKGDRHTPAGPVTPSSARLRSSAAPKGDRHDDVMLLLHGDGQLRSSAAPKGDRHSRPGPSVGWAQHRCDPRPPRRATATTRWGSTGRTSARLRSSAAPKGDRHEGLVVDIRAAKTLRSSAAPKGDRHGSWRRPSAPGTGCDPRPPRRATATRVRGRSRPVGRRCDPRPPRRATATSAACGRRR